MKQIIRLTESDLHRIISESVKRILSEDGEGGIVGGAAANGSGFMNGANNAQTSSKAQFDVPFGGVQRRKGYSPKGKNSSKMTQVDMSDALDRKGGKNHSISINRVGES